MNTIADQYYIKALDQYPYDLNETMENLNYALSYNKEHIGANYLMGKLHCEQLNQYIEAEEYYVAALASDPDNMKVCSEYTVLLIRMREFDKAKGLIAYTQKLKGVDISTIKAHKALINEYQLNYKKALKNYRKALLHAYDEDLINQINQDIKRVKMKKKIKDKTQKKIEKEV